MFPAFAVHRSNAEATSARIEGGDEILVGVVLSSEGLWGSNIDRSYWS
jgi:hypothetical protein